jgi:hypothetical protein
MKENEEDCQRVFDDGKWVVGAWSPDTEKVRRVVRFGDFAWADGTLLYRRIEGKWHYLSGNSIFYTTDPIKKLMVIKSWMEKK